MTPLSFRIEHLRTSLHLPLDQVGLVRKVNGIPPWKAQRVESDWSLAKFNKHGISHAVIKQEFGELQTKYDGYLHVYTDGAKTSSFVGCAVYSERFSKVQRLDCVASIFTAELYAVSMAIECIINRKILRAVLFVDSQSVILAVCSLKDTKNMLVQQIQYKLNTALHGGQNIKFCWVPSHIGIQGNEEADKLAGSAGNLPQSLSCLPYQDIKPLVKSSILHSWQLEWDMECVTSFMLPNRLWEFGKALHARADFMKRCCAV
ncbi:RNase H family protein [Rickettsia amblyommatis str. Darkwater]|nr:RNase H family protein [Rickettsia amblyommatis str. Darkwater]